MLNNDNKKKKQIFAACKKLTSASAAVVMLQTSFLTVVFADDKSNVPVGLNNSTNPDAWPWMQENPDSVKSKGASAAPSSVESAIPAVISPAAPTPAATPETPRVESTARPASEAKLETEHPKTGEARHEELHRESPVLKAEPALKTERPVTGAQPKSHLLFGRIEQLTSGTGASFPTLKAQVAKLDLQGRGPLKAGANDNVYSGEVVRSFPADMSGVWGGTLRLQQFQQDPLYYQLDADEAKQTAELAKPGIDGKVNFTFQNTGGGVNLEPAQIFFSSPMTQSRLASTLSHAGGMPGMGSMANNPMMQSMMMSMPYMWSMSLGSIQGTGLSGNAVQTTLIKNDVRQLSPTVIEEQVISREADTNVKTGRSRTSYSESVVRFTRYNSSQQYVQAVSVDYNTDKRFLRKMVFAGYVTKGAVQQVSPMGGMGGMAGAIPGAGGAGGAAGMGGMDMGSIMKMLQGMQGGGAGGMQGIPGFNPSDPNSNPFKGLFGQ